MNELVFRAVNAVEEGLNNASPESLGFRVPPSSSNASPDSQREAIQEAKQKELDNGIVQLESLLNATVDKDFDKFEIYTLRNILAVGHEEEGLAGWVQLEHYKNINIVEDGVPTPEEVQLQRRKFHETKKLNAMLKSEEVRNAAMLEQLRSLMGADGTADLDNSPFAFLTSQGGQSLSRSTSTGQPLSQNVQYALSQLPALRQHLAQLKEALHILPSARARIGDADEDDEPSEATKRQKYIESQSRRALERRGVDSAIGGAEDVKLGRRVGREEVEGIEAVVAGLEGRRRDAGDEDEDMGG